MRRRLGWVLVMVVASCGVPLDEAPRPFPPEVQREIVEAVQPPPVEPPEGGTPVTLYFVAEGGLVAVQRGLDDGDPRTVLEALVEGPPDTEAGPVRSAIPAGTAVLGVGVEEGVARVDLSAELAAVGGEEEILAVGQVVATLTALEEVDAVAFSLEGVETAVPDASGALAEEPLGPAGIRSLLAP